MAKLIFVFFIISAFSSLSSAACGANTRTWQANAGTTAWANNNNWIPANQPNAANENALIVSDWFNPLYPGGNITLGCLEVQSGLMTLSAAGVLTLTGDNFINLNSGGIVVPGGSTWEVRMNGTVPQTVENVDSLPRLRLSNTTTTTITKNFTLSNRFLLDAGVGNVVIQEGLTLSQATAFNIPSSATVTVESGATLSLNGDLTIDGILVLEPGSRLILANTRVITVNASGTLDINGTSGNAVTLEAADGSSRIGLTVNGTLDAQYLLLNRLTTNGVVINGTLSRFNNINITSILSGGRGMTLGAAASVPATLNAVGFYGDGGAGPFTNVNAAAFNVRDLEFTNWSGLGDTANETDGNNRIFWGTEAPPVLQIQNISPSGVPPTTIAKGSALTHFVTFAFSMTDTVATATEISQLTLTLAGTNNNSDISNIRVVNDTNGNCIYNAGVDGVIGNYSPSGSPGTIDITMTSEISVNSTTQDCLHVLIATSASATTGNTLGLSIASTDDVTNSEAYALSDTNGPPVSSNLSTITGTAVSRWNGGFSTAMGTAGNWTPNTVPNATIDCQIGSGYSIPIMAGAFSCLNTEFDSTGTINWNNTANLFSIAGAWIVESGFTYQTSANAVVNLTGTVAQSVELNSTTFPGNLNSNSTNVVTVESGGTINGNLVINSGTFRIASGSTLTVLGNITVANTATLDIEAGGTLRLGNTRILTVNSGGTLELVGSSSLSASVSANSDANSYTIVINNGGNIKAQYYNLRNLGLNGLTINATANIDGTFNLQNGSFVYPGVNSANLLRLFREVPGDVLDGMTFDSDGSGATSVISIFTSVGASTDTLSVSNFSGNRTGATFTNDNIYLVSWGSPTNQLKVTQKFTAPASANQGDIVNMGTFAFQQFSAGAFNDTDITSIRITLNGTGSSSDVDLVNLYYDASCTGTGGVLVGSQALTGSPARADFNSIVGGTVQAHPTTPPERCFYVTFNLDALATNGKTVGAEITSSTHVTNSEAYDFNSGFAPPITLGATSIVGTTTQWTGATSTVWALAGNWSSGIPNASLNCIINAQVRNPAITVGTAVCKSMSIGNGTLTLSGGSLELYGSLESTGTIIASAPVVMRDNGVTPSSQNIDITSTLSTLSFNKTAGGSVNIASSVNVTNAITLLGTQNFTLNINSNNSLIANGGLTLSGGVLNMAQASQLRIGNGQTLTINGGTFRTSGVNDSFPQLLTTKAHITNTSGTGTWAFSATSGTVDLTGFYFDWLNTSGLNFSGTVNVSNFRGGQLRNLPSSAGMRSIQFNNSGSLPATASNFGWNWGPSNSPPSEATNYYLAYSSGCGNKTIDFDQWFGDFWPLASKSTASKINNTNCNILIDRAKSPVSLTHLSAEPYDKKVILKWVTGNEWDHRGFNVYRKEIQNGSYVQLNTELIRNDLFSTTIHGSYAFIDTTVENNKTYLYMLEDIALLGNGTLHGPLEVTPLAFYGDPGLVDAGTIVSNSPPATVPGADPLVDAGAVKLSENVYILAQTPNYMRLKILVPNINLSNDPLNTNYQKVELSGYSLTTEMAKPELPVRTLLIPLPDQKSVAVWEEVSRVESTLHGVALTTAPEFINNAGQLLPQWTIDSGYYNQNLFRPELPIEKRKTITLKQQQYLPLVFHPARFNGATQTLVQLTELTLDLFLQGAPPWLGFNPSRSPWSQEGGIKLSLEEEGFYQVTYEDLYSRGVVAPLEGVDKEHIHLNIAGQNMGLDVISPSGQFSPGDSIRFYSPLLRSDEEKKTSALIYYDQSRVNAQATEMDVNPSGHTDSGQLSFYTKARFEQNNLAVFNQPINEELDYFMWSLIYGIAGGAQAPLVTDVELPGLNFERRVRLNLSVHSRSTQSINPEHHLEVFVNSQPTKVAEKSFQASEGQVLSFDLDPQYFVSGKNKLTFKTTGQNMLSGEYDMIFIDAIDLFYSKNLLTYKDEEIINGLRPLVNHQVDGFTDSDLLIYDLSSLENIFSYKNGEINTNADGNFIRFHIPSQQLGKRIWVGSEQKLKKASGYQLIAGANLMAKSNKADVLYLGHGEMLNAVRELGALRQTQGYKVKYVELESIYNEFGDGKHNVQSIKDFISYTQQWSLSPRYFILLGDGTYDPKAYQNPEMKYRFPIKLKKGSSFNYSSDHWFVSDDKDLLPQQIIARIPAKDPQELGIYIRKVLAYEAGDRRPSENGPIQLISDRPLFPGEDFTTPLEEIKTTLLNKKLNNPVFIHKRSQVTDAELKSTILNSFQSSSVIQYMGHGAENMWANQNVLTNSDVLALSHQKLPVVVAMNCLNAHFSDPDLRSLGENILFNENGGGIAFWGSTSLTPPSIQAIYQNEFYKNLSYEEGITLGEIIYLTKTKSGLSNPHQEVLNSWTLLGDPLIVPPLVALETRQDTIVDAPQVTPSSPSASSGCSAMAKERRDNLSSNGVPYDLIFSLLLEFILTFLVLRLFRSVKF